MAAIEPDASGAHLRGGGSLAPRGLPPGLNVVLNAAAVHLG